MSSIVIDFNKFHDGLVPAIIQDINTNKVLMLGYMNKEAFDATMSSTRITFFSRSKNRLWTKGEESGNFLELKSVMVDCDADALLFKAHPLGPVCHTGADTCWDEKNHSDDFLAYLEQIIELRKNSTDSTSYVKTLMEKGINKIAQKVGEEAVELVIEAKDNDNEKFLDEAADLMFHYLLLLNSKGFNLQSVKEVLNKRHNK
jgi:phosphoribosyl-ATP pyrophosphohydrolase/phosphoribosyl-AMP cyclohydrolase